jgi:trk system potassium uptake protein
MRIIIIGCGRMGSGLAQLMGMRGHAVTVVDKSRAAFERLGPTFKGQTIVGVGFDRDILLKAGIERADGLAAVTESDEANVVSARLASQIFRVPKVVARLYDPRKAEIYRRLGVQTISTTIWGINRIANLLSYSQVGPTVSISSEVDLVEVEVPPLLVGRTVRDLTVSGEIHVVCIIRSGKSFLSTLSTVFQPGDLLQLAVLSASADRLKSLLGSL